jgi:putative glutamine amidotransferase
LIGVTTAVRALQPGGITFCAAYTAIVSSLERAGALPVLIPSNVGPETLRALYDQVDGVLLPGGGDLDAKYFNESAHPASDPPDPYRDSAEVNLVRWAIDEDRPLFGICRGHQVINAALGGSLIQDIPSQCEDPLEHRLLEGNPRDYRSHVVVLNEQSRLAGILGELKIAVNSIHHQAVRDLARGFVATAYAGDGIIEASEHPSKKFALTVQWHPEDLAADDPKMQALFDAFVAAARG